MHHAQHSVARHHSLSSGRVIAAISVIVMVYLSLAVFGGPQAGTQAVIEAQRHARSPSHDDGHGPAEGHPSGMEEPAHLVTRHPPLWTVAPLIVLLGSIALLPLMTWTEEWWESNRNRFLLAVVLAAVTLAYYLVLHEAAVEAHWPSHDIVAHDPDGLNEKIAWTVLANSILGEYVPFIVLLFSLFTITGGIRIEGDLAARPATNTAIIAIGGLLASFIGTTGAAMLLIRLLLNTNRQRSRVRHTVVFFIFVVCNCGGCLLPIGDPPLFLGYLAGVPFLWTMRLWPAWLFVNVALLAIYYAWDRFHAWPNEPAALQRRAQRSGGLRVQGLWPNAPLLAGVVLSVALLDPGKSVPGTDWHAWLYLREVVQLALVGLSLGLGSQEIRRRNAFNYHAIAEVAALFLGIFICMQPALQILAVRGPELGLDAPWQYFWITGVLSGVLDNAPTYVVFFQTADAFSTVRGLSPTVAGVHEPLLVAVSLGAVFMGAMTYIGNGPNFMVKAIAETSGVEMPSFFGYLLYSVGILLPVLVITTMVFL